MHTVSYNELSFWGWNLPNCKLSNQLPTIARLLYLTISRSVDLSYNLKKNDLPKEIMTLMRITTFAMTNNERVAHRRKLRRIRQKRWRDKRKDAVRLVPPENLPLYTGHRLGQLVHSFSGEKAKARKRRTKQYNKILKNPRLLAEEKHKASWRGRVHRAYRGVFRR